MSARLRSLIVVSCSLLLFGTSAQPTASQEKSHDASDVITIRDPSRYQKMGKGSVITIVLEVTNNQSSQLLRTTAKFEMGDVMYGQFIGSSPKPSADDPKVLTSYIKVITPKYKGKYKFTASCHYEGEKVYDIHSKTLEIEIE